MPNTALITHEFRGCVIDFAGSATSLDIAEEDEEESCVCETARRDARGVFCPPNVISVLNASETIDGDAVIPLVGDDAAMLAGIDPRSLDEDNFLLV